MAELVVEYEPRLIEETVLLALRVAGEDKAFRQERDRLYEIAAPEAREPGFRKVHAAWFDRLGLDRGITRALHEWPSMRANTIRFVVVQASSRRDEGAELFVAQEDGGATRRRTVVIRLRPETLTHADRLRWLLRHELSHIDDMLDSAFGYTPGLPAAEAGPHYERLIRDRYGVLWDAYIDGRLWRRGWAPVGIRAERLSEFARAFPMLGERAEEAFDRFFGAASHCHSELMAFAMNPESVVRDPSRAGRLAGRCPLCCFPTQAFEPDPRGLPTAAREAIRGDFPGWDPAAGLCLQCADLYRARSLWDSPSREMLTS